MSTKINRRNFFKIAATGGAAAAVASCDKDPIESVVPYLVPPDNLATGTPYYFATTCQECSAQCGMVVKTREGRAIHVEGNPEHPLSRGTLCTVGNSTLQATYSPSRVKSPTLNGSTISLKDSLKEFASLLENNRGKVLYFGNGHAGAYQKLVDDLIAEVGGVKVNFDLSPVSDIRAANDFLFNIPEIPRYRVEKAKTLISFGADFLESWLNVNEFTKGFAEFHAYKNGKKGKFHHFSPHLSVTASAADQWHPVQMGSEHKIALALINHLLNSSRLSAEEKRAVSAYVGKVSLEEASSQSRVPVATLRAVAKSFGTSGGGLAIAGGLEAQSPENKDLQIAVQILNWVGGSINGNIEFGADYKMGGDDYSTVRQALDDLKNGRFGVVIADSVNIAHALPASIGFAEIAQKAKLVALSTSANETTRLADMVLPVHSPVESWGDSHPRNGVFGLMQPAMAKVPGFDSIDRGDLMLKTASSLNPENPSFAFKNFREFLMNRWKSIQTEVNAFGTFAGFWKESLRRGGVFNRPPVLTAVPDIEKLGGKSIHRVNVNSTDLKLVVFNTNLHNANGQTGDRAWLLEIPHPITQIVWDSWAELHHETAEKLGIEHGDEILVESDHGTLKLGAYVYHGVSPNTLAIPAGLGRSVMFPNYSRRRSMFVPFTKDNPKELKTFKVGANPLDLIGPATAGGPNFTFAGQNVSAKKTGSVSDVVSMDGMWRDDIEALQADGKSNYGDRGQKGRGLLRFVDIDSAKKGDYALKGHHHLKERKYTTDTVNPSSFYEDMKDVVKNDWLGTVPTGNPSFHETYRFAMTVDLDRCTGCSACVVACFSENNVPVVGKERQRLGRHMSWIRVERYFDKDETGGLRTSLGPMMCQQCGNAGCEPVCPVYATYHNPDGLNAQVYNRCVGTRYCSNNCIYKHRKFNWRTYEFPYPGNLQLNPSVTVRSKGVMEKCTFCVQRIQEAKIKAKTENRLVAAEEVKTACQKSCPVDAISFGNALDSRSKVAELQKDERGYLQLEEMNFQPAITYLQKVYHAEA